MGERPWRARIGLACVVVAITSATACGRFGFERRDAGTEARDSSVGSDGGGAMDAGSPPSDSGALTDGSPLPDAGPTVDGGFTPGDAAAVSAFLVINEIVPQMGDYTEIVNAGVSPLSLDGLVIADLAGSGSPPADSTHRHPFPVGITLAPGEHFMIAMNYDVDASPGLLTGAATCRGAPRCIQTSFGLLAGGDAVAVLDGSGTILVRADFPGRGATGLTNGDSWCRLPDVTGAFAVGSTTPGAVNAPL
jgi:hypothetical protein